MISEKTKKLVASFFLVLAVASGSSLLINVRAVHAVAGVADTSVTIGDIPRTIWNIVSKAWTKFGSRAFQQAVRSVSYQLAQESAVWIASGGKGQKPLLFSDPGKAIKEAGDKIAGKFIVNFSAGWPIDLCSPSSIQSKLSVTIGLNSLLKNPLDKFSDYKVNNDLGKGGCKLSEIQNNFQQAVKKDNFLVNVGGSFEAGGNELSSIAKIYDSTKQKLKDELAAEAQRRLAPSEEKPVVDPVTEAPKTTKQQIKDTTGKIASKAFDVINTGDIFVDTAFVFANTLSQAFLNRLILGYYPARKSTAPDSELSIEGSPASRKALLAEFDSFSPSRVLNVNSPGEIDLFATMSTCLEDRPEYQTTYHCLLNDGMQRAIQNHWTVRQAIDQKAIPGELDFPQSHIKGQPNLSLENLRKLRFLRVIPIGWEIAAERLQGKDNVSFSTIVNCFGDKTPSDCSSLYGLIDPNWVLELPPQFCRAQGWTTIPTEVSSPARQQSCVDLQSCVSEDPNGNCQVYGYCTREKSVWELSGTGCKPQFATCKTFTRPGGESISLLGSDVSSQSCDAANAGCTWYGTPQTSGNWDSASRVYLSGKAQSCSPNDAGSREIILLGPGINLVKNSSFDDQQLAQNPSVQEGGWQFNEGSYSSAYSNGGIASEGATQLVDIKKNTYYTLSFDATIGPNGSTTAKASVLSAGVNAGQFVRDVSFPLTIGPSKTAYPTGAEAQGVGIEIDSVPADSFGRYAATFFSSSSVGTVSIALSGGALFDNIQLEEVELNIGAHAETVVNSHRSDGIGLNIVQPRTTNQASPSSPYRSYDENPRFVFAHADICQEEESTSRQYRAVNGPEVRIAQLLPDGLCDQQCKGLDSYLSMPTLIDSIDSITTNDNARRVSFIPTSAKSCSARSVGCEEFTNVATDGVERREYYSNVQSCVVPENAGVRTFYTWEGTDTAGFQLKSWQLLAADDGSPCTDFAQGRATSFNPAQASCSRATSCDPAIDSSCRIFIDENGHESFRDQTKIVTASNECTSFRRTKDQTEWYFIPDEANQCSSTAAQCREYKGLRANTSPVILSQNFESGTGGWGEGSLSSSSDVAGGASYKISAGSQASLPNVSLQSPVGKAYILEFRAKSSGNTGRIDRAGFSIQPQGQQQKSNLFLDGSVESPLAITNNWQDYKIGPLDYASLGEAYDSLNPNLFIHATEQSEIFVDNIKLVEARDILYALAPSTLAQSAGGSQPNACYASPQYATPLYNRCTEYRDEKNNTYYVARFNRLFDESSLLCKPVIDTANSDSPYSRQFEQESGYTFTVPADDLVYRKISRTNARGLQALGCTSLGVPNDPTAPSAWEIAYKKVDPDTAQTTFCTDAALGCQAFKSEAGEYYFRDPGAKTCTWNESLNMFTKSDGTACTANDRNGDYAALCDPDQNSCTAYLPTDPNLGSTPLFYKKNSVEATCTENDVSLGCVELIEGYTNDTARRDKLDAAQNRLLKVTPQRQCAEWLAPTTISVAGDQRSQAAREISYSLGRCLAAAVDGTCTKWADASSPSYAVYGSGSNPGKLNTDVYKERMLSGGTIFSGIWDYSGYSIPNQYPVELLSEKTEDNISRLAIDGSVISGENPSDFTLSCRSYPEEYSPFPRGSVPVRGSVDDSNDYTGNDALAHLNLFEDGTVGNTCSYKKVSAPGSNSETGSVYYSLDSFLRLPENMRSIEVRRGWQGYCVEYDKSTIDPTGQQACLAWLPIDVVQNAVNVFDNHPEAGFTNTTPVYQCVDAASNLIKYSDFRTVNRRCSLGTRDGLSCTAAADCPGAGASCIQAASPNAYGISLVESKDNNYVLEIAPGDGAVRAAGFVTNFNACTSQNKWCVVEGRPGQTTAFSATKDYFDNNADNHIVMPFVPNIAGQYQGPEDATGLLQFSVRSDSPLAKLHEYDIESIKFIVREQEHASWPANNEEFVLNRDGFAASGIGIRPDVDAKSRWTALWCGGGASASCDFGGVYSWNKFVPFITDSTDCSTSLDGEHKTNLFAIKARFAEADGSVVGFNINNAAVVDNNGVGAPPDFPAGTRDPYQFLGFEGGLCDNTDKEGWVDLQMVLQLREWCSAVAEVATIDENKGWTGRLNNKSQIPSGTCVGGDRAGRHCYAYPDAPNRDCSSGGGQCKILFNVADSGAGKTGYLSNFFIGDDINPALRFTYNQDNKPFGIAVPPTETLFTPTEWDSRKDTQIVERLVGNQSVSEERALEPGNQPLYVEKDRQQVRAGTPLACNRGDECILPPASDGKTIPQSVHDGIAGGVELLRNLFAKIYGFWQWNFTTASYQQKSQGDTDFGWEFAGGGDAGQCPIVQSVVQTNGRFSVLGQFDPLVPTNYYNQSIWFTQNPNLSSHNGATTGLSCPTPQTGSVAGVFAQDASRAGRYSIKGRPVDNTAGIVSTSGWPQYVAIGEEVPLQFYAFNYNGEQLPLKEIYIDWNGDTWKNNDNSERATINPNHTEDDTIVRGNFKNHRPDCSANAANFGQTTQACDNSPFQFIHVYQKSDFYTPVVRVTDNWGKMTYAYYNGTVIAVDKGGPPPAAELPNLVAVGPSATIVLPFRESFNTRISANRENVRFSYRVLGKNPPTAQNVAIALNPTTGAFSGANDNLAAVGNHSIEVTATDPAHNNEQATVTVGIEAQAPPFESGWLVTYYNTEGKYLSRLNDFRELRNPVAVLIETQNIDFSNFDAYRNHLPRSMNDTFVAMNFVGRLNIGQAGIYRFGLGSDDGSYVIIDDAIVVDNSGDHATTYKEGGVALSEGAHKIEIVDWNNNGPATLTLQWASPGSGFNTFPTSRIEH